MSYIKPILIVNDSLLTSNPSGEKKPRKVEIYKNEVYKDIDLHTHKHVEASGVQDKQVRNAVSSDNSENVDGSIIVRNVEFRDAQLRRRLRHALVDQPVEYADDDITLADNMYRYWFNLPVEFKDNSLRALAEYIHRFLVFGALYDWYLILGSAQAGYYGAQLGELEDSIDSILRSPSIVKRPMQPFGPADKLR